MNRSNPFFDHPIINSPYHAPTKHWELDDKGLPTHRMLETRRKAEFINPIPRPKKRKGRPTQETFVLKDEAGISTSAQQYDPTIINEVRYAVAQWRALSNPRDWHVTPETARLLQHWRHHDFSDVWLVCQ